MASCLSCEGDLRHPDVEMGETVTCVECGSEHEVLSAVPLKLALVDDLDLLGPDDAEAPEGDDQGEDGEEY